MARGTQREIRFNIVADASDAEREVKQLGAMINRIDGDIGSAGAAVAGAGGGFRNFIGYLGDMDTALQTLGSTLGIEGLQIVGDFFAIGEAVGQLGLAIPALATSFASLLPAMAPLLPILAPLALAAAAVGGAVYALTQDYRDQQAEIERVTKATDDMNKRLDALGNTLSGMSQNELRDYVHELELQRGILLTQIDLFSKMGIVSMDLENAFFEVTQSLNQAVEAMDRETFSNWADNVRDFSDMTEEEAERQRDILERRLATEQKIFDEAERLYGENSEQAKEVARGIDEITASLEYMNSIDYSKTAANIAALADEGWGKLGDLFGGIGGLFDKGKNTIGGFFEGVIEGAQDGAQKQIEDQKKWQEEQASAYQDYLKEQARLQEEQEREWQRKLKDDERMLTSQLDQIKRFEETRWRIENDFMTAREDAIFENDATALYEARRTRRQARQQERLFGNQIVVNELQVGAISRPEDIERAKQMLLNALTATLSMQEGKYA